MFAHISMSLCMNFVCTLMNKFLHKPAMALATTLPLLIILLRLIFRAIIKTKSRAVYLVDFACYKARDTQKVPTKVWINHLKTYVPNFKEETLQLMEKMANKSGVGQSTYASTGLMMKPTSVCIEEARKEAEEAVFRAVDGLLEKTGVRAEEVGVLVVNCSLFNPVPSLCSMVINRYKMREDIRCYNLSGMGCGAGLVSIHLANNLLQVQENSYALVVSTENITQNIYLGNDRSKLPPNCIFRVGGAAILLSNRHVDRHIAKYRLVTAIRTHTARSDMSYNCLSQEEDSEGLRGITSTKHLIAEASAAITENLAALGPTILPFSEQVRHFIFNVLARKLHVARAKTYVPKFGHAVDHFITHVGGKPMIDAIEIVLGFKASVMEASRMTLYRFGNTSSSFVWYGLGYEEAKGRVKKGDKVWQIGFGAGFKCASVVWRAMKDVEGCEKVNPWMSEIHELLVDFNKVELGGSSSTGPNFLELLAE